MCIGSSRVHACLILSHIDASFKGRWLASNVRLSSLFTAASGRCANHRSAATDEMWPELHLTSHESRIAVLCSMSLQLAGCGARVGAPLRSQLQLCEQRLSLVAPSPPTLIPWPHTLPAHCSALQRAGGRMNRDESAPRHTSSQRVPGALLQINIGAYASSTGCRLCDTE